MADFKVNLKTEGALFNAANREAIENEEVRAYLVDASKRLERAVFENIPHNTGLTRGALFSAVRGVAQGQGEAIVSLPVEHAEALEMGSVPHWAPIAPLLLWATQRYRDKDGSVRMTVQKMKKDRGLKNQKAAVRSFAYAVQANIAKRGTRAYRMFAKAKASLAFVLTGPRWQDTLDRIAKRLSEK